jgi:hypothetical protein
MAFLSYYLTDISAVMGFEHRAVSKTNLVCNTKYI